MQLSGSALKVLEKRFLTKNKQGIVVETPEELFLRVARTISGAEHDSSSGEFEDKFYKILTNLEFLPNSPTLVNAGRELGQLSACFVLPIEDSMYSIFTTLRNAALVQKSGGGVGFNFSNLRPKGDSVKSTHKCAGGPVEFIKIYDRAIEPISQGGVRRGANMAVLRCDHPDILDFIHCKEIEGSIPNFNISVGITDDFMAAVRNNRTFDLVNPRSGEITSTIPAATLFDDIVEHAWHNGEPGILFLDEINRHNVVPQLGEIEATNPCISGDSLVATECGFLTIEDIVKYKRPVRILTRKGLRKILKYIDSGINEIFEVELQHGQRIKATAYHKFILSNGDIKECTNLKIGDKLPLQLNGCWNLYSPYTINDAYLLGWLIGDGYISQSKENNKAGFTICKTDADLGILDNISKEYNKTVGKVPKIFFREQYNTHLLCSRALHTWATKKMGAKSVKSGNKEIPNSVWLMNKESQRIFLRALFSADGSVNNQIKPTVKLTSKSKRLCEQVQILLGGFGIKSNILNRSRKGKNTTFKDGRTYWCDGILWELFISSRENIGKFAKEIRFEQEYKNKILDNIRTTLNGKSNNSDIFSTIISIKNIGREHTYCLNIDKEHEMAVGGIYTAQCGEQPLLGHESCNLGSLNLGRFIKAKQMDWDRLQYVTKLAVRFLDNVIDMNKYPLPQVETKTKITRKIGLGVMGFADMLIKLGIKYDTDEAIQKAHEVMKFIHDNALVASTELATLRGVFPAYRGSTWCTEHGIRLRNACLTTIAPTGTLSIIANCSSGIEPYYSKTIKKHVLETILEEEIEFAKEDSFITSHEISPEWHVKIQAAFQAHSDSAVSKTINFPENATLEDVKHAYMLAFKLKCKGLTIYRDHSRKKQVLTSESETSFNPMSYAAELCPQCQAPIITEEGCKICSAKCGWSACSTG